MYSLSVANNKLIGINVKGYSEMGVDYPITEIEVSEETYNNYILNPDKYMYSEGKAVVNPDYADIEKEKQKEAKRELLLLQIDELDKKRIRAVCEPSIKDETTGETWLDYYNSEIKKLREQLKELS